MGAQQDNSRINFVNIPVGTFSNIHITDENGTIQYTGIYQRGYSQLGTPYSNITLSYTGSKDMITASKGIETNKMLYGSAGPVHIDYKIIFGVSSTVAFSLSNGATVTYSVDGKSLLDNKDRLTGGSYAVTASYGGKTLYREIYIPDIKLETVKVNYSPSYTTPHYTIIVDGFFKYSENSKTANVYELENSNTANISAKGYVSGSATDSTITSLTLNPKNVFLNVFVSNSNVTVLFNGKRTVSNGGYHYLEITPGAVNIKVSKTGYSTYNKTINLIPGKNMYEYVLLTPDNTSLKEATGTVENAQYKYNMSNVDITYNGTSIGYTNQSGQYILFVNGPIDAIFKEYLYVNNTTPISYGNNPVVYMSPQSISVNIVDFQITYSLPLGFYFAFVSWDRYPLNNFAEYVVAYSNNSLMLNPHTEVITSSGLDFAFLPGITPGKTYYVIVDAYASNGSFISSKEVTVSYNLFSYMINILIFLGLLAYVVFVIFFFMRRRKRKKPLEDEEYDYFKYN